MDTSSAHYFILYLSYMLWDVNYRKFITPMEPGTCIKTANKPLILAGLILWVLGMYNGMMTIHRIQRNISDLKQLKMGFLPILIILCQLIIYLFTIIQNLSAIMNNQLDYTW